MITLDWSKLLGLGDKSVVRELLTQPRGDQQPLQVAVKDNFPFSTFSLAVA